MKSVTPDDTARQGAVPPGERRSGTRRADRTSHLGGLEVEEQLRRQERWDDLVELYLVRVEAAQGDARVAALEDLADLLWHDVGDPAGARDALVEALALDPGNDRVADDLLTLSLAASADGWTTLVDAVSAKILLLEGTAEKARLAERLVRWAEGEASDPVTAERFLSWIRDHDPGHALVHRRLARQHAEAGDWQAQREALERALDRAERDEDRRALHVSLGELFEERLPDPRLALEHFERARALSPGCMPALAGLERLCRRADQPARLRQVLEAQVDAAGTGSDRAGALVRLAELLERAFLRPTEAADRYEQVLELEPGSARASDGLERCWLAARDWDRLASALELRAARAKEPAAVIAALSRLGEVRESKLRDLEGALTAWRRVYELDTSHREATARLAALCERRGDLAGAAAYRGRLADLADDPREKARIHVSVGEMLAPPDRDPACARVHFERAVELDPKSAAGWEQLQRLAERDGDTTYATFCLERRAERAESARLKGQLLVELARLRGSQGDRRGALATFEYAFEADPTNEVAAAAVVGAWSNRGRWRDAQVACDVLVTAATRDGDREGLLRLLRLSTRAALSLGDGDRALAAAAAACALSPADPGARDDALEVCHSLRQQAGAKARIQSLLGPLLAAVDELSPAAVTRLGEVRLALGDAKAGIDLVRVALARDPESERALAALAGAFSAGRDWGRAANCRLKLGRLARDPARASAHLLEAATLWERARSPARAASALEEALATGIDAAPVLRRLVALLGALSDWERLVAALVALAGHEPDPAARAKVLHTAAGVLGRKLHDPARAVTLFEQALDADPARLDAFESVVRVLTQARDWRALEAAYRRMLARLAGQDRRPLAHQLHHQLGLVYRDRMGDLPRALAEFRRAAALAGGDDAQDRRIVVELQLLTGRAPEAVADLRRSLQDAPLRASAYHDLYEVFLRQGAHDRAWCTAGALAHLGAATPAQRAFLGEFPPQRPAQIRGTLAKGAWASHLVHPELDPRLTAIFGMLAPAVVKARAATAGGATARPLSASDSALAADLVALVRDTSEILGLSAPALLAQPRLLAPLSVATEQAGALLVSLPALEAVPTELLPCLVARRLAALRPELLAHATLPTLAELRWLLAAAVRIAVSSAKVPVHEPAEAALALALGPGGVEALRGAVSVLVGRAEQADVRRWHRLADLSIARVGLLVGGDLERSWQAVQREPRSAADLPPAVWRAEMLRFAVSDELGDLRRALGVHVEERAG